MVHKKSDKDDTGAVKKVCGIVMPISAFGETHSAEHWRKVKTIFEEAISNANCEPQPVWVQSNHDIIQSKILQNLFENDIVLCDVSTLNPNVMLELGMRLTTRKPTIIVAENDTKLPFDTNVIEAEFYDKSLDYHSMRDFVEKVTSSIEAKLAASEKGTYKAYLEAFTFETVTPDTVAITTEEKMSDKISELSNRFGRLESLIAGPYQSKEDYRRSAYDKASNKREIALNPSALDEIKSFADQGFFHIDHVGNSATDAEITDPRVHVFSVDGQKVLSNRVVHPTLGKGSVVSKVGKHLVVKFDGNKSESIHSADELTWI